MYHAHVQHPRGSGYMMQTGSFHTVEDAVRCYLELVDANDNPFGRNALATYSDPIEVLLIPSKLHGPDAMAYTGFCSVMRPPMKLLSLRVLLRRVTLARNGRDDCGPLCRRNSGRCGH